MTVKTRGIQLKKKLNPEDQGQRKLLQVTYSQLAFLDAAGNVTPPQAPAKTEPKTAAGSKGGLSDTRRRTIALMLRVELEATLNLLDQALEPRTDS
jgi:hypothetical protein